MKVGGKAVRRVYLPAVVWSETLPHPLALKRRDGCKNFQHWNMIFSEIGECLTNPHRFVPSICREDKELPTHLFTGCLVTLLFL